MVASAAAKYNNKMKISGSAWQEACSSIKVIEIHG